MGLILDIISVNLGRELNDNAQNQGSLSFHGKEFCLEHGMRCKNAEVPLSHRER